jgi:Na+/melibiose symporter-like transporter
MGATWSLLYPCFADVIDEIVVKTQKRNEGIYYGFRTFIGRFSIVIQAATFGIVHTVTHFDATSPTQIPMALWGIRIHSALIPALFYFLGFLAMWLVYDLTPAKTRMIKEQLLELKL